MVRIDDVRCLDDGGEGNAPVGDVQVVVRADAAVHAQQQADHSEVAAVIVGDATEQLYPGSFVDAITLCFKGTHPRGAIPVVRDPNCW